MGTQPFIYLARHRNMLMALSKLINIFSNWNSFNDLKWTFQI